MDSNAGQPEGPITTVVVAAHAADDPRRARRSVSFSSSDAGAFPSTDPLNCFNMP